VYLPGMTLDEAPRNELLDRFRQYFETCEPVVFSYAFGSFINSAQFRDIDIGVYLVEPVKLQVIGRLQYELQDLVDTFLMNNNYVSEYIVDPMDPFSGVPVDVVVMNDLPDVNPELSQDILNDSICLKQAVDEDLQLTYRLRSLHQFEDTRYLRALSEGALRKRLKEKRFGDRNYES